MNRILLSVVAFLSKTKVPQSYRLFFTVSFLFSGIFLNAQVANYSFSQASGTYSALTGSPNVAFSSGWDDNVTSAISIGFTFTYNGVNYTDCSINSNGFITFGTTFSATAEYNPISGSTGYAGAISALGRDLVSNSSTVSYSVSGSSPNRVFVVQWTNTRRYYSGSSRNGDFNFQIRLNEGSNTIQIVYGACATTYNTSLTTQVGLRGASNTDFNNRTTTSNWPASTAGGANNVTCRTGDGVGELPTNGLTYTWTPPCTLPTVYAMTGAGGSFCSTLAGSTIGLANSQTGVSYQLLRGSVAVGSAVAGTTGSAISFGTFNTTGTYTVLATRNSGSCTSTMSGSVSILSYSSPPTPTATATNVSCPADATGTITVTNAAAPASVAFVSASNQYINFGTPMLSNRSAFTVEGWIKFDPANYIDRMSLFGQNDVIEIAFEGNSLRCWTYSGGSVDLPLSSFPAGNAWHHIAVTGDGTAGGLKIYLDGGSTEPGGVTVTGGIAPLTGNYGSDTNYSTKIGWGIMDAAGVGLTGEVFKLGFWNRALTVAEIKNMSSGFVVYDASQTGLLAGYSFNEGSGTTVAGVGSVAPTGTFVSSPVWTDPYVYSWTSTPGGFVSSLKNITGLSSRTYNLTTSLKGCTNSGSWVVNATNTAPTITTTGTVPAVCFSAGVQPASLVYAATSGAPTTYNVDWNAAANTAGLADQANTAFAFLAGGGTINTIAITAGTPSGSYAGTMTIINASGCTVTQAVTMTVNAIVTAGTIGTAQTICNGATPATLTSSTAGTGSGAITYEWQTNASGSYVTIGGATSATYSPPALTTTTSYQRRTVSVSGGTTCYSGYTTPVTITVNAIVTAGAIGTAQTICNGSTPAALTSTTAGTGSGAITYEWQTNASGSYVTIGGATSATYSPPALTATTSYQRRTVSVNGGTTCYSGYTTPVTITVNAAVTAGTIGTAQAICNGATPAALISTTAGTGSGAITYEWQTDASGSYVTIGGATSATYSPPALTATTSYQRRTVSVSGGTTCYSGYTTPVTITVNATVTAGAIGTAQAICNGATPAALTSTTAGTGSGAITYEWQTNASGSYVTIGGATSATYSPPALITTTSYQRRTVSVSGGTTCYSGYTTPVTITVNATVTAGAIGTAQAICNGSTPAALTSTTVGTGSGVITYEWQTNASGSYVSIGGATSATYSAPALTATTSYQRRTVSVSGGTTCYSGYTTPVTITVNALPTTPTASATAQPTCVVPTGTITVTAPTGAGMSYSVDGSDYSNTSGVFPGLAVGAYTLTVKNGSGCISLGTPVSINAPITNTWNGTKWSKTGDTTPPTATDIVVFNGPFTVTTQLNACSCQINSGINVVVGVAGGTNDTAILKVENGLNVDPAGSLTFENNASLVQVNDAGVNTGDIVYKRNAKPMKNFDYTYWSSPVVGQKLNVLSPNTLFDKYFSYVNNAWKIEPGVTQMGVGKGYIIRTPKDNGGAPWPNGEVVSFPYSQPVQFIGVPNNGAKNLTIGTTDGDGNLVGNPYPSAMSADAFLAANNKEIDGTIYFWTHNTAISNLMYSSTDYASYNGVGGVNTLPAASGGTAPDGNIAAGQSFFTVTKKAAGSTGAVTFNNNMRVGLANSNAQFFKGTKSKTATVVKHRVWLNLANDNGAFKQTLVGYVTGATLGNDTAFDGESFDGNKFIDFYSINDSKNLVIQGRALPFDKTDKVPLGYKTTVEGTFKISIDKVDGALANQTIFVEDKVANVIHNLKDGSYSFTTGIGVFNDRFVLRYTDNTPVVTDPIVKDPIVKDPVVTDPIVKDPIVTDPVVKDPVVTDPIVKDPVVTDPVVKDPIVKDPIVTNPVVKDPIITNPIVTDPIALDPTKGGTLGTDGFENKGRGVVVYVKDHQIKINSFDETIGAVMVYDLRGRLLYQNEHVNKNEFSINNLDSREQFLIVLTQLINGKWITKEIIF